MNTETLKRTAEEQIEAVLIDMPQRYRAESDARFEVKFSLSRDETEKMHAWWNSESYEKALALQKENQQIWMDSLQYCVNYAANQYGSGAEVMAKVLVSFYNSNICKVEMTDLWCLDSVNFQHVMNCIRLLFDFHCEPHTLFNNGNELFQHIIKRHGLKKGGR